MALVWKSSEGERRKDERLRERRGLGFEKKREEEIDREMREKMNKKIIKILQHLSVCFHI